MSTIAVAAVSPPAGMMRLRRRRARHTARARAPMHARRGANYVTAVASAVAAGDAEHADKDDGAARPLTAVIVGGGPAGLAACRAQHTSAIDTPLSTVSWVTWPAIYISFCGS